MRVMRGLQGRVELVDLFRRRLDGMARDTVRDVDGVDDRLVRDVLEMTGRASPSASAASSSERAAACVNRCRGLKFVRVARCASQMSGRPSRSQRAWGAPKVKDTGSVYSGLGARGLGTRHPGQVWD